MVTLQIYDFEDNFNLKDLFEKTKSGDCVLNFYDLNLVPEEIEKNAVIARLYKFYGENIFPVTLLDGEVKKIESHLSVNEFLSIFETSNAEASWSCDSSCSQSDCKKSDCEKSDCNQCDRGGNCPCRYKK